MYKYIKGTTVMSENKMYTANDIAKRYSLWKTPGRDKQCLPNGELVREVIEQYIFKHNYKTSDFYYVNSHGYIVKVYPQELFDAALKEFVKTLKENGVKKDKDKVLSYNDIEFLYFNNQIRTKIVSVTEIKKRGN